MVRPWNSALGLQKLPSCLTGHSQIIVRFYGGLYKEFMVISFPFSRRVPQKPGCNCCQMALPEEAGTVPPLLIPPMQMKMRGKDFSPKSLLISWCIYNMELCSVSSS